jgi:hypothetical protein
LEKSTLAESLSDNMGGLGVGDDRRIHMPEPPWPMTQGCYGRQL